MVQAPLKRHPPAQVYHHDRGRDVEEQDRHQPEHDMRRPQLRRRAYPTQAHHEQDLREDEVPQPQFFLEAGGMSRDAALPLVHVPLVYLERGARYNKHLVHVLEDSCQHNRGADPWPSVSAR